MGILYIVATPIGNLEDITIRALRILHEVDSIACEDTRQTSKLLGHFGISKPVVSYYEHNESARAVELVKKMAAGANIALVTDAGTPLLADPGYRLVQAALAAGLTVVPIPGVSAAVAALSAAGLPTDEFRFCGFLPARASQRQKRLQELKLETCTLILYETPHRILDALADVESVMGSRPVVVAREITKLHEEFLRGTAGSIRAQLAARPAVKGEITLLIGRGTEAAEADETPLGDAVRAAEQRGLSRMDAIKQVARERGLAKREVYRLVAEDGGR